MMERSFRTSASNPLKRQIFALDRTEQLAADCADSPQMVLVAEPYQRQGFGSQAWRLLVPWLADQVGIEKIRLGVEQFNVGALCFFQHLGFAVTGESNRIKSGQKLVRLLYMEQELGNG